LDIYIFLRTKDSGSIQYDIKLKDRIYETLISKNENFSGEDESFGTQVNWMKLSKTQVNYAHKNVLI
jgi:hypothetical protein